MSKPTEKGPLDRVVPLTTLGLLLALLVAMLVGLAPNLTTRAVEIGESFWPGYAAELRSDPVQPTCDLEELKAKLETCPADGAKPPPAGSDDDPFGGKDPFAEPGAEPDPFEGKDPFAEPEPEPEKDPFEGKDPFAEPEPSSEDPFAGKDPFAEPDADDPFAGKDPFAEAPAAAPTANCPALRNLADKCERQHADYLATSARVTSNVKLFRSVEQAITSLARFPFTKHLLALLVILGGLATTIHRMHIALRNPTSALEHRVAQGAQLAAHVFWALSCVADYQVQQASAAELENPTLPLLWAGGFVLLGLVNVVHMVRVPAEMKSDEFSIPRILMVVPLYAYMGILGGVYFLGVEQHSSGQAIFLHKFVQHPSIYLGIGLYIWAGMLLSRTRIARLAFDVLLPFKLPPSMLAWLTIVLAALPTAYSGASGIFVIAAGAVIFERLTAAGASPRTALAATAMSGSLGVVLRPCLVVVLVAVLNKQVTTDQLFDRGLQVFLLTCVLSLIALWWRSKEKFAPPPVGEALSGAGGALLKLLPYGAVGVVVLLFNGVVFKTWVNEHTAALVLPAVMLALVVYDRMFAGVDPNSDETLVPALGGATGESSHHIGALLLVMAGSVGVGGVVERAEVMALVPESFGSVWITMCFLVVVMVLVGMTMDALGAVVLVSVTVAKIAYDNGIDPVHFWMMVLVAFELGYLTPPVALNHLLARQVVGPAAEVEIVDPKDTFFESYEHIIVPMMIMGTALVLVAFVPLFFY